MELAEVGDVVRTYPWKCVECKNCEVCKKKGDDVSFHSLRTVNSLITTQARILFCDSCDRGKWPVIRPQFVFMPRRLAHILRKPRRTTSREMVLPTVRSIQPLPPIYSTPTSAPTGYVTTTRAHADTRHPSSIFRGFVLSISLAHPTKN
jgi:hypothetical protein